MTKNKQIIFPFAAGMMLAIAANLAFADCAACGGGCVDGGCHAAASALHHGSGECHTCANIWDGYCESKHACLPPAIVPFSKLGGHAGACGCSSCAPGVGIYGARACCGPKLSHGLMNWVKKAQQPLFSPSCDQGCDAEVATACDSGCDASPCGQTHPAAKPRFNYVAPESSTKQAPATEAGPGDSPADIRPEPPVPPAPVAPDAAVPSETTDVSYGAFSWLKRSLNLD